MARTPINPSVPSKQGGDLVFQPFDNANGIDVSAQGTLLLLFRGGAQDRTVTLRSSQFVDGGPGDGLKVPDRPITIPSGGFTVIGPFNPTVYDQGGGHYFFDCPASLQFAAILVV